MRHVAVVALIVLVAASSALEGSAATSPRPIRVTLDDKANDASPADLDLTSVSLAKRDGTVIVRMTVRGPITGNASYTADMAVGVTYTRVVAKRTAGRDSFQVYGDGIGTTDVAGAINGRTVTVTAPIRDLAFGTPARVRAYFWSRPTNGRSGVGDRAPESSRGMVWLCLSDRRPRPKWGPCVWP